MDREKLKVVREDDEEVLEADEKLREYEDRERAGKEYNEKIPSLGEIDTSEVTLVLKEIDKQLDQKKVSDEKLLTLMWEVDQSNVMLVIRAWWNRLGSWTQKTLFNIHKYPMVPMLPVFRPLVSFGFLEMKNMSEQELDKIQTDDLKGQKWALKALKFIAPEVKAFSPLLEMCFKLEERQQDFGKVSRKYLHTKREQEKELNERKDHHLKAPKKKAA